MPEEQQVGKKIEKKRMPQGAFLTREGRLYPGPAVQVQAPAVEKNHICFQAIFSESPGHALVFFNYAPVRWVVAMSSYVKEYRQNASGLFEHLPVQSAQLPPVAIELVEIGVVKIER